MARVNYTKTYFNEPGRIDQGTYEALKIKISRNPNYDIDTKSETFSQNFKEELTYFKIGGILLFPCLIITANLDDDGIGIKIFGGLAVVSFLAVFFTGIMLLLEGPSYATYLKKKSEYFSRLKYAIQNTNSYYEFCISFYGR
jgi:hypothetical protein